MQLIDQLQQAFPNINFKANEPLATYTTVKIGGPAEVFCMIDKSSDLVSLIKFAQENKIAVTMLGWGANSLISDEGIKGLVIKNISQDITIHDENESNQAIQTYTPENTQARWQAAKVESAPTYEFDDIEYHEDDAPRILVTISAGASLPATINNLLRQGVTGLQWFSRIPATVGGGIYNNIHGGTHFIGDHLVSVTVVTPTGEVKVLPVSELELDYDFSRFHHSKEIIISADFLLFKGDVTKAQAVAIEWAKRKAVQPQNSLGCIFQNLTPEDQKRLSLPTPSIGYLIQHTLDLQGFKIGDAQVSTRHAAFIENLGNATATDYLALIKKIISDAEQKCHLTLKPEIFFLGFTPQQLEGIVQTR